MKAPGDVKIIINKPQMSEIQSVEKAENRYLEIKCSDILFYFSSLVILQTSQSGKHCLTNLLNVLFLILSNMDSYFLASWSVQRKCLLLFGLILS